MKEICWIVSGIGVANGPAEPARRPTKYPAGPENVSAGPVKTDRSPWQVLVGATGYAPSFRLDLSQRSICCCS